MYLMTMCIEIWYNCIIKGLVSHTGTLDWTTWTSSIQPEDFTTTFNNLQIPYYYAACVEGDI